jgi:hypothetical protein
MFWDKRSVALFACVALAAISAAEDYQAIIYGAPSGTSAMTVLGAGDNGMMTGYGIAAGSGEDRAGFLTQYGYRDLHPAGFLMSRIMDSWGSTYHTGYGFTSSGDWRALFWVGGGAPVNLSPDDQTFSSSYALAGGGQWQVGHVNGSHTCAECNGTVSGHAARWTRTKASFTKLHAVGYFSFMATCTDGVHVGGYGNKTTTDKQALLWSFGSIFATDLHPAAYQQSEIYGLSGTQQGGMVRGEPSGFAEHAALWTGSAGSLVDLNPSAFFESRVRAVRSGLQVGHGRPVNNPSRTQAIAWRGKAATWINLHSRLPYPYVLWKSYATDIDNLGNIVGYIVEPVTQNPRPVIWRRV